MDGVVLLAVILQAITIYTPVMCLARLLMGTYCGIILGLVPTFVVSLTPSEFRGYTGTFSQISITLGMLAAYWMGQNLDHFDNSVRAELRIFLGFPQKTFGRGIASIHRWWYWAE